MAGHATRAMLTQARRMRSLRSVGVRWKRAKLYPATARSRCAPPLMPKTWMCEPTMQKIGRARRATLVSRARPREGALGSGAAAASHGSASCASRQVAESLFEVEGHLDVCEGVAAQADEGAVLRHVGPVEQSCVEQAQVFGAVARRGSGCR
jgi:hypothetical protein